MGFFSMLFVGAILLLLTMAAHVDCADKDEGGSSSGGGRWWKDPFKPVKDARMAVHLFDNPKQMSWADLTAAAIRQEMSVGQWLLNFAHKGYLFTNCYSICEQSVLPDGNKRVVKDSKVCHKEGGEQKCQIKGAQCLCHGNCCCCE